MIISKLPVFDRVLRRLRGINPYFVLDLQAGVKTEQEEQEDGKGEKDGKICVQEAEFNLTMCLMI